MLDDSVAERYAEALFSVAVEHEKMDIWKEQLSNIVTTVSRVPFLDKIMKYPFALKSDKRDIFTKVFSSQVDQQVLNFIYLIIDHDRGSYLKLIYEKYAECIRKSNNRLLAEITSAKELSKIEESRLVSAISRREGRIIEPIFKVDPSLIGGVVVKIEGKVIDGSLKKSLKDLGDSFAKADFSQIYDSDSKENVENLEEKQKETDFLPKEEIVKDKILKKSKKKKGKN